MSASTDLEQLLDGWEAPVYYGEPHENVTIWMDLIQAGCDKRCILEESFTTVARRYLGEKPKSYITKCERSFVELSPEFKWNWTAFKMAMVSMTHPSPAAETETTAVEQASLPGKAWDETNRLISEHPVAARAVGAILLAASAPILAPVASAGALSMIGFGSAGPIAGTLVASVESAVLRGAVGNSSVLATVQSVAGNQATVPSVTPLTVAAVLSAVLAAIRRWFRWKGRRVLTESVGEIH